MNKIIVISTVILFSLFHRNTFSSGIAKDSINMGTSQKIEKDISNDFDLYNGFFFGQVPNPFSPSNVHYISFYIPLKTTLNFNMLDTNNLLVYKISSIELEKGFYKAALVIESLKAGKYYLEMETAQFRCRLVFYQIS